MGTQIQHKIEIISIAQASLDAARGPSLTFGLIERQKNYTVAEDPLLRRIIREIVDDGVWKPISMSEYMKARGV